MRALGIESSCDETAAAVVELPGRILSNVVHGQVEVHARYGGVVPELASRAHARHIQPVIEAALAQAGMTPRDLDCVAVTIGPGLIGGLLTGLAAAKGFALGAGLPLVGVHHMEGHLMSPFLDSGQPAFDFPFVALLVSGGHTLLLHARAFGEYLCLGQTRDDAVGEAFDKGARLLGLGYPGGPAIARLAEGGDPQAVHFPRALPEKKDLDFSFSGLKTALRTFLARNPEGAIPRRDVAASYQEAIVDVLTIKSLAACRAIGQRRLVVAGGVGANRRLREVLRERAAAAGIEVCFPAVALCTDNGAMIALAGLRRWRAGERDGAQRNAMARWPVERLLGETQRNA
ncbi:MAG: tRNA (adenosine(37)-N6)-threonylcarbamoyltransferase complex transferase subunit TsaD [Magnetococcales bacterium]|nr:tRNA (adenosine(37)-N6)-threonylcarbamoyltransferase complex transferase subunit TsaD [Magnetococcales bacterium]